MIDRFQSLEKNFELGCISLDIIAKADGIMS